jgi:hypothetical protein
MNQIVKIVGIVIIVIGLYTGVRYVSTVIHYACANPAEDCPPPFYLAAQIGWFVTGGDLVPFWTRE